LYENISRELYERRSLETRWGNTDEPRAPQIIATNENINYATSYTIASLSFDVKSVNMKKGVMPYTASLPTTQKKYLKQVNFSRKIERNTSW